MSPNAVLFDLDDTLMPEGSAIRETFAAVGRRVAADAGIDGARLAAEAQRIAREAWRGSPFADYSRSIGLSATEALWCGLDGAAGLLARIRDWLPEYRAAVWKQALSAQGIDTRGGAATAAACFVEERNRRHTPYPGTLPVLESLRGRYRLGLVTNGAPAVQLRKAEAAGLAGFFDTIVVSGEIDSAKPDARVFQLALSRLGERPEDAVMVGDRLETDIEGARRCGIRAILVARDGRVPVGSTQPDAVIADLTELHAHLEPL